MSVNNTNINRQNKCLICNSEIDYICLLICMYTIPVFTILIFTHKNHFYSSQNKAAWLNYFTSKVQLLQLYLFI